MFEEEHLIGKNHSEINVVPKIPTTSIEQVFQHIKKLLHHSQNDFLVDSFE
jgi:hypothetical protein